MEEGCSSAVPGRRTSRTRLTAKSLLIVALSLAARAAAQQPAPAPPPPAPAEPAVEVIPLTQIALRGEVLNRTLRDTARRLPLSSELRGFEEELKQEEQAVKRRLKESSETIAANATLAEIKEQVRHLRVDEAVEARQRKVLNAWGEACEESIAVLTKEETVWQATLKSTREVQEVGPVLKPIRQALTDIRAAKAAAEERLRRVLGLQGRVSSRALAVADMLEKLGEATQQFQNRLFHPDAPPIWRLSFRTDDRDSLGSRVSRSVSHSYTSSSDFVREREGMIGRTIVFLACAFLGVLWLTRGALRSGSPDPSTAVALRILRRPIALAVLISSPLVLTSLPLARMSIVLLLIQLFILPITRLLPLVAGSLSRRVHFLSAFYVLNGLAGLLDSDPVLGRAVNAVLFAAAAVMLVWWERTARIRAAVAASTGTRREILIIRAALGAVLVILMTNVFGFVMLSNVIRVITLLCSYVGLVMYTLARVLSTLLSALVSSPRLGSLATFRMHRQAVARWIDRALSAGALFLWIYVTLDLLGLRRQVSRGIATVLNAPIGVKALSIPLGNIIASVCILVIGYLVVRAIRFVLSAEILSRLRLSRGVPEMISTSLYYALLMLVFLMSVSAVGVQLDKLTVLTGAVGIGVGFGLQNLVNNFASGLIIQFERPIRVGDILEVSGVSGEVSHIGVRASTVRTFQGAEVIIPNSVLVSNQVTNWTLSEARRRVDIGVRVAYGTEPERVMEILAQVANRHPEVLRHPETEVVFQGFGPSALEFLLMFWAEQSTHFRVRSEVSLGINAALREAGIEVPVPQQDIRVLTVDSATARRAAGSRSG